MKQPRRLPETKDDWQLYDKPGAGAAARSLTSALKRAAEAITPNKEGGRKMDIHSAMNKYVYPKLSKYASLGASDTEPRGVALDYLESLTGSDF